MTLSVNPASRVFCNRSLNMANIAAVGFDMDYTLAMYKPETFEVLAYESACKKLVEVYGYPEEITRTFAYDHAYMVRGLVVDKKRGNILKMDRHRYVKVAHHGFRELDADTRLKTYCDTAKVDQVRPIGLALRKLFTRRSVSTFDRVGPFQLTGERFAYGTTLSSTAGTTPTWTRCSRSGRRTCFVSSSNYATR